VVVRISSPLLACFNPTCLNPPRLLATGWSGRRCRKVWRANLTGHAVTKSDRFEYVERDDEWVRRRNRHYAHKSGWTKRREQDGYDALLRTCRSKAERDLVTAARRGRAPVAAAQRDLIVYRCLMTERTEKPYTR
jgi:hypothetical protein